MSQPSDDSLLFQLKARGPQTAQALGQRLAITSVAVRKQLTRLADEGLVDHEDRRETVGRPKRVWSLTEHGHGRFPDSHSVLTVELLGSLRKVFGEEGLERLIADRERETLASYRAALASARSLRGRLGKLAELRSREGYMAEWERAPDGSYLLIENHCPICAAAKTCQGLCRSELAVFEAVLGPDVEVTRLEHILAGARRCAYRIAPRSS